MDPINTAIHHKFHIKRKLDPLPHKAWQGDRTALAQLFGEVGFTKGAEVGVENGRFSKHLLAYNPALHLTCVDPWAAFSRKTDEVMQQAFETTRARLARFGDRVEYIRKPSLEGARDVADGSLDFVYIDGLHDFDSVMGDILAWAPKVRPGGMISGHDYCHIHRYGVIPAVDAYTRAHNIFLWYITFERTAPQAYSYFWVK